MNLRTTSKLATVISIFICTFHTFYAQDVNLSLGTLAPGATVTIKFKAEVNISFGGSSVSNQGTVSGANFASLFSDDPGVGGASDPTVTPIVQPAVPVELVSFASIIDKNNVDLLWETATEVNNYGFEVERAEVQEEADKKNFQKIGFVPGSGNSNFPQELYIH